MRAVSILIRCLALAACAYGAMLCARIFAQDVFPELRRLAGFTPRFLMGAGGGAVLMALCGFVLRRPIHRFWQTLEHEYTHLLVALAFLKTPVGIQANIDGEGEAAYERDGNWLIALAPYFVPLTTLVLLAALPVFSQSYAAWVLGAAGAALAVYWVGNIEQLRTRQQDIQEAGPVFAWPLLIAANVVTTTLVACLAVWGTAGWQRFAGLLAAHHPEALRQISEIARWAGHTAVRYIPI